jgi:hypothetical protein
MKRAILKIAAALGLSLGIGILPSTAAVVSETGGASASAQSPDAGASAAQNSLAGPPHLWSAGITPKNHTTVDIAAPYIPLVACRLVDTRGLFSPVYAGGPYAAGEIRTYNLRGNCGIPADALVRAAALQVIVPPPAAAGDIEILPNLGTFGNTVAMVFEAGKWNSVSVIAKGNAAGNELDVQIRSTSAHLVIDIVGYYADGLGTGTEMYLSGTPTTGLGLLNSDLVGAVANTSAISATSSNSGVDLATAAGNALDIVGGGIRVQGAGLNNTSTAALVHTVNTAGAFGSGGTLCPGFPAYSVINHVRLNNNPNAIVQVTPLESYGNTTANGNYPVLAYWSIGTCGSGTGVWTIHRADNAAHVNNMGYSVLIINP